MIQADGQNIGFRSQRTAQTKTGATAVCHKESRDRFRPDTDYILLFSGFQDHPHSLELSVNFIPEEDVNFEDLFSEDLLF
jgi:hypothetical protein